jgi:uncharacterized protein YkwD
MAPAIPAPGGRIGSASSAFGLGMINLPAGAIAMPQDLSPVERPDLDRFEGQMLAAANAERANAGLEPLRPDPRLTTVARWRSDDMATRGYFSHDIGGYMVFTVLRSSGYEYRVAGENLAYNYSPAGSSVSAAHSALMNSPAHRENILRGEFTHAGVGLAVVPDGRRVYTQIFSKPAQEPLQRTEA